MGTVEKYITLGITTCVYTRCDDYTHNLRKALCKSVWMLPQCGSLLPINVALQVFHSFYAHGNYTRCYLKNRRKAHPATSERSFRFFQYDAFGHTSEVGGTFSILISSRNALLATPLPCVVRIVMSCIFLPCLVLVWLYLVMEGRNCVVYSTVFFMP